MKWKLFCIVACLMMIFSAFGCESSSNGSKSDHANTVGETDSNNEVLPEEYKANSEIKEASLFDRTVQIGNETISIPLSLADFMKQTGAEFDDQTLSEDYLVDANGTEPVSMVIGEDLFKITVENFTSEMAALKECTVNKISLEEGNSGVFYAKGITIGSTLTQLKEAWGEADDEKSASDTLTYYYLEYPIDISVLNMISFNSDDSSATGNYFSVTVDRNSSVVTEITYNFTSEFNSEQTITNSMKFDDGGVVFYNLPIALKENNISASGKVYVTKLEADHTPYIMKATMSTGGISVSHDYSLSREERADIVITDELLISDAGSTYSYSGSKYTNIDIINNDGETGTVTAYEVQENKLYCIINYVYKGYSYTFYYDFVPYEANVKLSDSAINELYSLVKEIAETYTSN